MSSQREQAEAIKSEAIKYFLDSDDPIEVKRDKLRGFLEKFEYPIFAKTLFEIFIQPLRFAGKAHKMTEYYALAMFFYVENDFDYVAVFMGMEGTGKSTLAAQIGLLLKRLGKRFGTDTIIYTKHSFDEAKDIILNSGGGAGDVIMFDEGRTLFDLRSSMIPARLSLLETFTTERWRRNIYFICISDISEIDKYFRERRARTVFVIPDRKIFFALQNKSIFGMGDDRFGLDRLNMQISFSGTVNYTNNLNLLKSLPTCHGVGIFHKFDYESEFWKDYMTHKKDVYNKIKADKQKKLVEALNLQPHELDD